MPVTIRSKGHRVIVQALIKARQRLGLRQLEAAKRLRTSQTLISRIELGVRRVDVVEFVRMGRGLKIDVHKLLNKVMRAER